MQHNGFSLKSMHIASQPPPSFFPQHCDVLPEELYIQYLEYIADELMVMDAIKRVET